MNILVTGGAGFIGQHLVKELSALGHKVIVADFPEKILEDVTYYGLDLSTDSWDMIADPIDIIYHLAAQPYGRGSEEHPFVDLDYNTRAFLKMCYFAEQKQVKKIIYTSTMAIYGNNDHAHELDQPQPLSNYAVSKLYGEFCLKKFASQGTFAYSILRLWNTYGPGQDLTNKNKGIVSSLAQQVVQGSLVEVTGSLERYRDLIHVRDVVTALILCLQSITDNQIFNVSSGKRVTVQSIIESLIEANGKSLEDYAIINTGSHSGDQHGCVGDNSKLKGLGWITLHSIPDGFREFLNYIKSTHG